MDRRSYVPHRAVTSHPAANRHNSYILHRTIGGLCVTLSRVRQRPETVSESARPVLAAIEWDLKVHYGVTDEIINNAWSYQPP